MQCLRKLGDPFQDGGDGSLTAFPGRLESRESKATGATVDGGESS